MTPCRNFASVRRHHYRSRNRGFHGGKNHPFELVHRYTICYRAKCDGGEEAHGRVGKVAAVPAERSENNVLHLVFDMPGRPMNVFSNAAIAELAVFSRWLRESDVKGVVIRSGKPSAFCAGADLADWDWPMT